jgi:hypothetical protein
MGVHLGIDHGGGRVQPIEIADDFSSGGRKCKRYNNRPFHSFQRMTAFTQLLGATT